ncbi:MAG: outer membrane beta-barrel protein [Bacteroidetes bacterium]|nr:outer membrane beta-barrel protein [Bacteroidota bacterium]
MKKTIIFLLLLLPLTVFCSDNDTAKISSDSIKTNKMELGMSFSPDFCFRKLKPAADSKWIADIRDTLEVPKFGYTVGANFTFKVNNKIDLETGVFFSDSGEKTKKYSLVDVPSGQKAIKYSCNFHDYYLNIPVKVNYYFLIHKLNFYLTAGISANIFVYQKTTLITSYGNSDSKTTSKSTPGFSRVNIAVLAGFGIKYPVTNKINLKIEPLYMHSATSIIKAPIKTYFYSLGVNVGICQKF